jgi:Uncharacterized conserved protein (DUF2304).
MLNLKYTLLWLFAGVIMLVVALFPQIISIFTHMVGVITPSNALFSILIFFILLILMSLTAIVSKLKEQNKRLIQQIGIMEKRIRDVEIQATESDKIEL